MAGVKLIVNGETRNVEADPETPLLWVLRDRLGLTGTKFSCGVGLCGSCAALVDGQPARSCTITLADVAGKKITTIEGLSDDVSHPIQQAWLAERVPQCGYCQVGQMFAAAALLERNPDPSDAEIDEAMSSTLCRCGTYARVRRAIRRAAKEV